MGHSRMKRGMGRTALLLLFPLTIGLIWGMQTVRAGSSGAPSVPKNVFAKGISGSSVAINWQASTDDVEVIGYYVYRSDDDINYTMIATKTGGQYDTHHTDTGLAASTHYYYKVSAYDNDGLESDLSPTNDYSHSSTTAPEHPHGLSATTESNTITISWSPNPEPNIAGYNVYRSTTSGGTLAKLNGNPLTTTSHTDNAVTNYIDYYYRVTAVDTTAAEGSMSVELWAQPEAAPPPISPHVAFTPTVDACAACHRPHAGRGPKLIRGTTEKDTCFVCHDGTGSQNNVMVEFYNSPASRHPVPEGTLTCRNCHNNHISPTTYPKMLSADYQGTDVHSGNEVCYACHGTGSALIGGDHETAFEASRHNTAMPNPQSGTQIRCSNCHIPHGSPNLNLKSQKEEFACFKCHAGERAGVGCSECHVSPPDVPDIFDRVFASSDPDTHHDVFDSDQQAMGTKIECVNCHNPHGSTRSKMNVDPDSPSPDNLWSGTINGFCLVCHDGTFPTSEQTSPYAPGVVGYEMTNIKEAFYWGTDGKADQHGDRWASKMVVLDPSMGFVRGDVLECYNCHEPHGTLNNYNLRSEVTSMVHWTFTKVADTTVTVSGTVAEYRFYVGGWTGQRFRLEVYDGSAWTSVALFTPDAPPPSTMSTMSYDVSSILDTRTKVNAARMRFIRDMPESKLDGVTFYVDGVRLVANGTEYLYGTTQEATQAISNPGNSIDGAFNDAAASMLAETKTKTGLMVLKLADGQYDLRFFCNACHGRNHMGNRKSWPVNCTSGNCHGHGKSSF